MHTLVRVGFVRKRDWRELAKVEDVDVRELAYVFAPFDCFDMFDCFALVVCPICTLHSLQLALWRASVAAPPFVCLPAQAHLR